MSHITYEQLLELISWGVFTKNMKGTSIIDSELSDIILLKDNMQGACYNGIYVGSPGRDIYCFLPYMSDDQMREVAKKLSEVFPKNHSGHHVQTSSCIRSIYGMFQKEGVLLSDTKMEKMREEDIDWTLPMKFLNILCEEFKKIKNYYGLCITYEINGHRFGDEAIIDKDVNKLELMSEEYEKSVKYASKCNCKKQIFTPYYWGAKYYDKYGDKENAVKWYSLMMKNFNKKGAKRKGVYTGKLIDAANRMRKLNLEEFKNIYNFYIVKNNIKENRKPLRKALRQANKKIK
jgi:hypothetical protein